MNASKLVMWVVTLVFGSVALLGAAIEPPPLPGSNGIELVAGSYVYLNHAISPNDCSIRGATQTFCFQAISYTDDYDYIYYLWQRFPSDWTVNNVYVEDTPYCTSGGTFGAFDYWKASANEVRIAHIRYQANPSDSCTAYYCFDVTTGGHNPGSELRHDTLVLEKLGVRQPAILPVQQRWVYAQRGAGLRRVRSRRRRTYILLPADLPAAAGEIGRAGFSGADLGNAAANAVVRRSIGRAETHGSALRLVKPDLFSWR